MSGTYITIRKANFQALIVSIRLATKEKPVVHTGRLNNRIKAHRQRKASRSQREQERKKGRKKLKTVKTINKMGIVSPYLPIITIHVKVFSS